MVLCLSIDGCCFIEIVLLGSGASPLLALIVANPVPTVPI